MNVLACALAALGLTGATCGIAYADFGPSASPDIAVGFNDGATPSAPPGVLSFLDASGTPGGLAQFPPQGTLSASDSLLANIGNTPPPGSVRVVQAPTPEPEPGSLALLCGGLLGVAGMRFRRPLFKGGTIVQRSRLSE